MRIDPWNLTLVLFSLSLPTAAHSEVVEIAALMGKYPMRNQRAQGTCYANTAATIIDSVINRGNTGEPWVTSSHYLAAIDATSKLPQGRQNFIKASIRADALLGGDSRSYNLNGNWVSPYVGAVSQGSCFASSSMTTTSGGYVCSAYYAAGNNGYRICRGEVDRLDETATAQNYVKNEYQMKSWLGAAPSYFEKCRMEMFVTESYENQSYSARTYAKDGSQGDIPALTNMPYLDFKYHPAFSTGSGCRKLFDIMMKNHATWWEDSIEGVRVGRGTPFDVSSCFASPGIVANCNPEHRRNLIAITEFILRNYDGLNLYADYLKNMCFLMDAHAALRPYDCRFYQLNQDRKAAPHSWLSPSFKPASGTEITDAIMQSIRSGLAVGVSLDIFMLQRKQPKLGYGGMNHAVTIVGFDTGPSGTLFRIRNSWGHAPNYGAYEWDAPGITVDPVTTDRWIPEKILIQAAGEFELLLPSIF